MRFAESKRKMPWMWIILIIVIVAGGILSFCEFKPTPRSVQKTIVFEAD